MPRTRKLLWTLLCAGLLMPAAADAHPLRAKAVWGKKAAERVPAHKAQEGCVDADLQPDGGNDDRIRTAILCLHNEIRDEHGLPALRKFPGNKFLEIAMIRMNHNGTRMDAEAEASGVKLAEAAGADYTSLL